MLWRMELITRQDWLNTIENESDCQERAQVRDRIGHGFPTGEGIANDVAQR